MEEKDLREIVTENLIRYRKTNNYTQASLAEKINYSDKAVSKWERGESIPDLYTLAVLAEVYGITINDLVSKETIKKPVIKKNSKTRKIITILAFLLVWLVATIAYLLPFIFTESNLLWLSFVYAIPISTIVLLVFSALWGSQKTNFLCITLLIIGIILSITITMHFVYNNPKSWLLFIAFAPLELINIFWFLLRKEKHNK